MIKILMHGCNGAMGKVITELLKGDEFAGITAGVDLCTDASTEYPVYASLNEVKEEVDVVIDFANAKAVDGLLEYCIQKKLPLVLCTTGLSKEQIQKVEEASAHIPVLRSANMSLGINLLLKLVKDAAKVLGASGYDMEIVEKHHRRKLDAPSGTALALADALKEILGEEYRYIFDRSERHSSRDEKEIGISAVRGGTIVGEHDVLFAGEDEVITISHTAYSRRIFAKGAVAAARFLAGKTAGMYTMQDVIG